METPPQTTGPSAAPPPTLPAGFNFGAAPTPKPPKPRMAAAPPRTLPANFDFGASGPGAHAAAGGSWTPEPWYETAARKARDFLGGFAQSAEQTLHSAAALPVEVPSPGRALLQAAAPHIAPAVPRPLARAVNRAGGALGHAAQAVRRATSPPEPGSAFTALGRTAEQTAEMALLPEAGFLAEAPDAVRLFARPALSATTSALDAAAHGQSPTTAAAMGAGFGLLGEASPRLAAPLKRAAVRAYTTALGPSGANARAAAAKLVPGLIQRRRWFLSLPHLARLAEAQEHAAGDNLGNATDAMIQHANQPDFRRPALPSPLIDVGIPASDDIDAPISFPAAKGPAAREPATGRFRVTYTGEATQAPPLVPAQEAAAAEPNAWNPPDEALNTRQVRDPATGRLTGERVPDRSRPKAWRGDVPTKVVRNDVTGKFMRRPASEVVDGVPGSPAVPAVEQPPRTSSEFQTAPRDSALVEGIRQQPQSGPGVWRTRVAPEPGPSVEAPYINTADLNRQIESLKDSIRGGGGAAPSHEYDTAISELTDMQHRLASHGRYMSYRDLNAFRAKLDDLLKWGGNTDLAGKVTLSARRKAANVLRAELSKAAPSLDKLKADYHFARGVMDMAHGLERGAPLHHIAQRLGRDALMTGAGAALGHGAPGALFFTGLSELIQSPAWRSVSAITKDRIADALAAGNGKKVAQIVRALAVSAAGQSEAVQHH